MENIETFLCTEFMIFNMFYLLPTFIFVLEHMGINGNERADMLAGSATISGCQPMERADILNTLLEWQQR
uniref:RNase H type-1 domain-containing protein n=1 Tax=Arion vulgaris TaxID=1028688 RepID=A0A0B7AW29_9EUPU